MNRGFTLLEVMVAMAILALGLTTILSSQTGLFATTRRVQFETEAASLVRCKMSEIELDLLQNGFGIVDETESGECCQDEDSGRFQCEWSIETVQLPDPVPPEATDEDSLDLDSSSSDPATEALSTGDLAEAIPTGDESLGSVGSVEDLAGTLAPSEPEGGGIIGMALSMVYPSLKPMLEASIRKVKVRVVWREGEKERSLDVTQYITNPLEGSLTPNLAEDLAAATQGATTGSSTSTGTQSSTTSSQASTSSPGDSQ
ncbi:MAG TPA: type II secretion system protein [Polyangiaceae bacterium]|nr:type II secretion system protein [Polyangiaceae bacterium]